MKVSTLDRQGNVRIFKLGSIEEGELILECAYDVIYLDSISLNFKSPTSAIKHSVTVCLSFVRVSSTEHAHYCVHVTILIN